MKSPMMWREILKSQLYRFSNTLLHLAILSPVYLLAGPANNAAAVEIAAGMAAVEEGDDRMRPAVALHAAINELYAGRVYYYGRKFGPVREETVLVSAHRRFPVFGTNFIKAQLGVALMNEATKISYDGNNSDKNDSENNANLGAAAGMSVSLPTNLKPFYAHFSWDSHLFPAGLGGILLSTGRKQTLSLAAGVLF